MLSHYIEEFSTTCTHILAGRHHCVCTLCVYTQIMIVKGEKESLVLKMTVENGGRKKGWQEKEDRGEVGERSNSTYLKLPKFGQLLQKIKFHSSLCL